jgi:uncharacterized RDD family membrane protein YckC
VLCSNCGVENIANAKFCQNCGAELQLPTPEMMSGVELASLGSRGVAYLIDMGVIIIIGLIVGFVWGILLYLFLLSGTDTTIDSLFANITGFIIFMGYFILLEGPLGKGQTLGKRLLKIRVVNKEDRKIIGYGGSFLRNILRLIDGIFFYLIGILSISSSDLNQRIGDKTAHTIVIKEQMQND